MVIFSLSVSQYVGASQHTQWENMYTICLRCQLTMCASISQHSQWENMYTICRRCQLTLYVSVSQYSQWKNMYTICRRCQLTLYVSVSQYSQWENMYTICRRCQLVRFTGCLTSTAGVAALAGLGEARGAGLDISLLPPGVSLQPLRGHDVLCEWLGCGALAITINCCNLLTWVIWMWF